MFRCFIHLYVKLHQSPSATKEWTFCSMVCANILNPEVVIKKMQL